MRIGTLEAFGIDDRIIELWKDAGHKELLPIQQIAVRKGKVLEGKNAVIFTGGDEPYEKLKRALKAEIDEAAWQSIYSTKSRPFDAPKSKKIAVKVINHYGDEVLKVYQV